MTAGVHARRQWQQRDSARRGAARRGAARMQRASRCRCIPGKWAAQQAAAGKPIIHLNTKPERCAWLKLMLFLPQAFSPRPPSPPAPAFPRSRYCAVLAEGSFFGFFALPVAHAETLRWQERSIGGCRVIRDISREFGDFINAALLSQHETLSYNPAR